MRSAARCYAACLLLVLPAWVQAAVRSPVFVGLDAEVGHATSTSDEAIRQGIEIAIEEINARGGVLGGRPLQLIVKDNRSVPARGIENLKQLADTPDVVAVFCGKFSPVVLEQLPTLHERRMILLDPWAAADAITDHSYTPSYTFRLSLRDSWAMDVMMGHAVTRGATQIGLLLPNTAWGRSNQQAAEAYAKRHPELRIVAAQWYNWGDKSLLTPYRALLAAGAQTIVLAANEGEGSILVRELAALPAPHRLPLISHWGITGGDFPGLAGEALKHVDLTVVQTFSFIGARGPASDYVRAAMARRYGVSQPERILSPVGVAHAYDLTHILARAIDLAGSTDRTKVRGALEQVRRYRGLIKTWERPFSPRNHDALDAKDVFLARYHDDGTLVPLR